MSLSQNTSTKIIGDRGEDGDRGRRGDVGLPGEAGDAAIYPFTPAYINTFVGSDVLTHFETTDTVDGGGRKLAWPLVGNNIAQFITVEQHPEFTLTNLGSRIILPDFGMYEYHFEVYVRNVAGSPQDIYAYVPLQTGSMGEAVFNGKHVVKNVPSNGIAKITGHGLTTGVYNSFAIGQPSKHTFFIVIDSSTHDSFLLPNGNDLDFSGSGAPQDAKNLVHSLLLKKIADNMDA